MARREGGDLGQPDISSQIALYPEEAWMTTRQHYVPQLLLKHFVFGSSGRAFVFDKQTERSFHKSIKKVACGLGFDDCEVGGEPFSIGPFLWK